MRRYTTNPFYAYLAPDATSDRKAFLLARTTDFAVSVRELTKGHYDTLPPESAQRSFMADLLATCAAHDRLLLSRTRTTRPILSKRLARRPPCFIRGRYKRFHADVRDAAPDFNSSAYREHIRAAVSSQHDRHFWC